MPRGPPSMPQMPIAVSKRVKCWFVMANSNPAGPTTYLSTRNLGSEIVANPPDSGNLAQESQPRAPPAERPMQTLRVNAYDMAFLEVGQGAKGAPPLVCVH